MIRASLMAFTFAALLVAPCRVRSAPKGPEAKVPDFTKGDLLAKDAPHDWMLGPTGVRGWIHTADGH